jgi:predicted transcriptional regulator
MSRKSVNSICEVCGSVGRMTNYSTRGPNGKIYYYEKFTHRNGVVHYHRILSRENRNGANQEVRRESIYDIFQDILQEEMKEKGYRFKEIKKIFEDRYQKKVSNTTIYRIVKRFMKLNLIEKKKEGNIFVYVRTNEKNNEKEFKIKKMAINYRIHPNTVFVNAFINVENLGRGLLQSIPISLPVGPILSLEQLSMHIFDEVDEIQPPMINLLYSYTGQSGISVNLNRPLKKYEDEFIFLNFSFENSKNSIEMIAPQEIDFLRLGVDVQAGLEITILKRLLDGLKESRPLSLKKGMSYLNRTYAEVEFEGVSRGEALTISFSQEKNQIK